MEYRRPSTASAPSGDVEAVASPVRSPAVRMSPHAPGVASPRTTSPAAVDDIPSAPSTRNASPCNRRASVSVASRGLMDVLIHLRFSHTAQLAYIACVAVASMMLIVENEAGRSWWYHAVEGVLTALFMIEIGYKISLKGFGAYIAVPAQLAELCVCILCIMLFTWLFFAPSDATQSEAVLEAILITLRYTVVLGRFCFFVRSSAQQQGTSARRVELHAHDNAAITVPAEAAHPTSPAFVHAGNGVWAEPSDDDSDVMLIPPATG